MQSCIYEGIVRHQRFSPVEHSFQYRLFMAYLDLDELPAMMRKRIISPGWFAPASYRRSDHFGDRNVSLQQQVRDFMTAETGDSVNGPIRMLAQLRYFGYYFSPLNLFFCFDESDRRVKSIVAEVQNTPWRERHCYVLWAGNQVDDAESGMFEHEKSFHVSPFMPMDVSYRWRVSEPQEKLNVSIENIRNEENLFHANMSLEKRPLTRWQMWRTLLRFPVMTAKITAAIYYQAFRLWRKKCPFHPHPIRQLSRKSVDGKTTMQSRPSRPQPVMVA